jgi:hypothetical protein
MAVCEVIPAAASVSGPGKSENQDSVAVFRVDGGTAGAGVVICDGVGSLPQSGAVASEVMSLAASHIQGAGVRTGIWGLEEMAAAHELSSDGATTLIAVGAEPEGLVSHCFVGNGSLFEIAPQTAAVTSVMNLRWCGLALPQLNWERGQPALESFLPAPEYGFEAEKGCRLTSRLKPRLYLACSDGVATDEDCPRAKTPDGRYWKGIPTRLIGVLDALAAGWQDLLRSDAEQSASLLQEILDATLATLFADGAFEDDASVGCVMTRPLDGTPSNEC